MSTKPGRDDGAGRVHDDRGLGDGRGAPIAAIRPSRIPTSARTGGPPRPSITRPPRIRTSNVIRSARFARRAASASASGRAACPKPSAPPGGPHARPSVAAHVQLATVGRDDDPVRRKRPLRASGCRCGRRRATAVGLTLERVAEATGAGGQVMEPIAGGDRPRELRRQRAAPRRRSRAGSPTASPARPRRSRTAGSVSRSARTLSTRVAEERVLALERQPAAVPARRRRCRRRTRSARRAPGRRPRASRPGCC